MNRLSSNLDVIPACVPSALAGSFIGPSAIPSVQIKHAQWRVVPPLQTTTKLRPVPLMPFSWLLGAALFIALATVPFALGLFNHDPELLSFALATAVFGVVLLFSCAFSIHRKQREAHELEKLVDAPEVTVQIPVRLSVLANRRLLGNDIGHVFFSGDLMQFQGRKTSFGFPVGPRSDAALTISRPTYGINAESASFNWRSATGAGQIVIQPYPKDSTRNPSKELRGAFAEALRAKQPNLEVLVVPPIDQETKTSRWEGIGSLPLRLYQTIVIGLANFVLGGMLLAVGIAGLVLILYVLALIFGAFMIL